MVEQTCIVHTNSLTHVRATAQSYPKNSAENFKDQLVDLNNASVGLSHQSYNFNDNQYALAIDAAAPVSAFRKDLIKNKKYNHVNSFKYLYYEFLRQQNARN